MSSGKHRLNYWKERHQLQRIAKGLEPTRDFVYAARFVAMGEELKRMMELPVLPWPRDLFSQQAAMMSQPLQQQHTKDAYSLCSCGKEHRRLYPRTQRSTYGTGFSVRYFCSDWCRGEAIKKETT